MSCPCELAESSRSGDGEQRSLSFHPEIWCSRNEHCAWCKDLLFPWCKSSHEAEACSTFPCTRGTAPGTVQPCCCSTVPSPSVSVASFGACTMRANSVGASTSCWLTQIRVPHKPSAVHRPNPGPAEVNEGLYAGLFRHGSHSPNSDALKLPCNSLWVRSKTPSGRNKRSLVIALLIF